MRNIFSYLLILIIAISFVGCKKWAAEKTDIYKYIIPPGQTVSDAQPLCGSIKGTMLTGKIYTIGCDVTIAEGDTLIIQEGAKVNVTNEAGIVVLGSLLCNGTQANPIYIGIEGITKTDQSGADPSADPAFAGKWKGIIGGPNCPFMIFKWTRIEFGGAAYGSVVGPAVGQKTSTSFAVLFQNYQGIFIMEDSWLYGATDDAMRISNGKIDIMRNTFEKTGPDGGDCINVKGGTVGTMAYNFFIGTATNGQKASNKGQPNGAPQTNIVMYNNTFVNGGYRQIQTGRGANINYEEGARGMYYNNVAINCKYGFRVVNNPAADTANLFYGYNYQYADSVSVASQFYPQGYITKPMATDIPAPSTFLPPNYSLGDAYDGSAAVQKFNPMFVNYPLPVGGSLNLRDITAIGSFNFHLQSASPLIGKGYTGTDLKPLIVVPVDLVYGATEITPPGADLGCFQSNGNGNKH